jgi:hypothetical protein
MFGYKEELEGGFGRRKQAYWLNRARDQRRGDKSPVWVNGNQEWLFSEPVQSKSGLSENICLVPLCQGVNNMPTSIQ